MATKQELSPEELLEKSENGGRLQDVERFRTILENIQEGYYEVDLAGNHIFFNDALCHILRFSREELQGKNYRTYMEPETSYGVYKKFNEVYRTGEPVSSFAYEITRGDGEPASIELSIALMRDEAGEPCGFQGIIRDNTERKLAEEELKRTHEELEQRVEERTAELAATNRSLEGQIAERREAQKRLERRRHFIEALSTLSRETSAELDFDVILNKSIKIAGEALNATSAYVSTWDRENGTTMVIAEYMSPMASDAERVSDLGDPYSLMDDFGTRVDWIDEVGTEPYILHIDDPDIHDTERAHFEKYGNKTEMGFPLVAQGQLFGMLEIWESRQKRTFNEEEMEFVKLISPQIATILKNKYLLEQAQEEIDERKKVEETLARRNDLLETLNVLSRESSLQHDFDTILHNCVKVVVKTFEVTSAYISAFNWDQGTSVVVAEYIGSRASDKEKVSDKGVVYSLEEDFGKLIESIEGKRDKPYVHHISDPDISPTVKAHYEAYGNKTELGIPLVSQGEIIGLLEIWESEKERHYSPEELEVAELVGRQIAAIFNNNRLYEQAQQEIVERRQAEEVLGTLNELAQETYGMFDLNAIFERIVTFTGRFINATSAYISRIDMDARTITVAAEYFSPDAADDEKVSDLGETYSMDTDFSTSARLIEARKEYYINHIDDEGLLETETAHMLEYGAKSVINFLMVAGNRPVAVLEFWDSRQKREFTEDEIGLIRAVTNQVSRAIENAELYEQVTQELQERRQAEEALRESQEVFRILTESSPATIYMCYNEPGFPLIYLNDAIETLTGYPKEKFLEEKMAISSLFHPEDKVPVEDEENLSQEGAFRDVYRIKHRSGEWRWIEDFGAGVLDQDGNLKFLAGFMNDITDRRRLEEQVRESLERRNQEIRLSAQVAREIAAAPDLNELYRRIVTQVKEQFEFYHVQLLHYDPLLDSVSLIAGYGQVGLQMVNEGHQMPMGVGLIGSAAATGVSYLQPDVTADPNWQANPLLPDTKGELAVPIKLGSEVLGVLDIQSNAVDELSEDTQLAMEGLCGQLAIAIESTRLRQEMNDRLKELSRLQQLMSREGWRTFQARHEEETRGYFYDQSSTLPLSFSSEENGGGNGRVESPVDAFKTNELRQIVTSPLTVRGESIGTLAIQDEENQPLTTEDRELLESISVQVAEALESARLLEQTQKNAADMETVAQVGAAASTILETQELLQTVVDLTKERFGLYFVSVFAMNEEKNALSWVAGTQLPAPPDETVSPLMVELKAKKSLMAAAGRTGKPVVANDVLNDEQFMPVDILPDTRSELVLPLVVGDELLGVMDLQAENLNRFGEDDVRIHTTLAAQVAVAWKNALLYDEQLETAKRLREVDRLKSEFMASMSHELRTPLNSIIGFSDVLLEGIDGQLNERMVEDVTLIRDSGRHLRELISEILDMSKIEAGMMDLRYDVVDISRVAQEIIGNARSLAFNKSIDVRLEIDPTLDKMEADRTRLVQILLNLTSNAVKFTNEGAVSLKIKDKGESVYFAVEDTGIGIDEEDIPIIFEQFRQIDGSLTRKAGGTGLGMPISKSLVELHGGKMMVESKPDVGSVFSFTIPKNRPTTTKPQTGPLPVLEQN